LTSATGLHNVYDLSKDGFGSGAPRHLSSKDTESWEIIEFSFYKSQ